jgi:hypothetical protein
MTNISNQSTKPARLTKTKGFILASLIAGVTALPLIMPAHKAQAENEYSEQRNLAGTWVGNAGSTLAPALASFMVDGRVVFSRPVTVQTGPSTFELVSAGHGEWLRTGHHEFTSTLLFLRSGQNVEFTGMVKLVLTINLNRATDQLAVDSTAYIYDAAGNLLVSLPQPGVGVFKRIVAGQ